jgi:hypothetical protein
MGNVDRINTVADEDRCGPWTFAEFVAEEDVDDPRFDYDVGDRVLVLSPAHGDPRTGEVTEVVPGAMEPGPYCVVDYDGPGEGHVGADKLIGVDEVSLRPDRPATHHDLMQLHQRVEAAYQQIRRLHHKIDVIASRLDVGGVDEVGCPECGEVGQPERVLATPCPHDDVPGRGE